jgi:hypothetical protein
MSPSAGPFALKVASAYATVRTVRLLQEHGPLPGGDGLVVAGVHVHHCVHGALLVAGERLLGHLGVQGAVRANLLAVGCALVLDELDVLVGQGAQRTLSRPVLDGALLVSLLAAAVAGGVRTPAQAVRHWRH